MTEILVRDLDDAVVGRLKERARDNGRSFEAELKRILEDAAQPERPMMTKAEARVAAERIRAIIGDRPQTDSAILLAEDRAR